MVAAVRGVRSGRSGSSAAAATITTPTPQTIMKRILMPIAAALAAFVLPGCLQQHSTITVNKDGSGTIVEETTFGAQMAAMMGALGGLGGEEGGAAQPDPLKDLADEGKAKERAASIGEGVTLDKIEPIDVEGRKGVRVTYKFTDINKVKYTSAMEDMGGEMAENVPLPDGTEKPVAKPMSFKYADGTLTITNPDNPQPAGDDKAADGEAADSGEPDAEAIQAEAMAKAMLSDMKVSMKIVVPDGIAETNATHVDGGTITLMDIDFGKVLGTPGLFTKMQQGDKNPAAVAQALKEVKGIKVEEKKEITVKVK